MTQCGVVVELYEVVRRIAASRRNSEDRLRVIQSASDDIVESGDYTTLIALFPIVEGKEVIALIDLVEDVIQNLFRGKDESSKEGDESSPQCLISKAFLEAMISSEPSKSRILASAFSKLLADHMYCGRPVAKTIYDGIVSANQRLTVCIPFEIALVIRNDYPELIASR